MLHVNETKTSNDLFHICFNIWQVQSLVISTMENNVLKLLKPMQNESTKDFFLRGDLKNKVYANESTTIQQLKNELMRLIGDY